MVVELDNKDEMLANIRIELYYKLVKLWIKENKKKLTVEDFDWSSLRRTAIIQANKMNIKIPYDSLQEMGDLINSLGSG